MRNIETDNSTAYPQERKNVEAMKDPGFHIGKIETRVLDAFSTFGLKFWNTRYNGEGVVVLNEDGKFKAKLSSNNWPYQEVRSIALDKWTKEIVIYALKEDGWNNPNAPLRVKIINADGTFDDIVFEKFPEDTRESHEQSQILLLNDGRSITLTKNPSNSVRGNYSHIVVWWVRYDIIPDSVKIIRNGGTTFSSFSWPNWKIFDLSEPAPQKTNERPELTERTN